MSASGWRSPFINLGDGHDVPTAYSGEAALTMALEQNEARPRALASGDFDEDGVPDLVGGYAFAGGGIVTLMRGNADAIYPNAPEAQARRARGEFTTAPFLSPARAFSVPEAADFIGTGDFDADGHWDVVASSRGGQALYLFGGDGNGGLTFKGEVTLPGALTAMTTGEINRADGLTDVVVGVDADAGAQVLVFEGPEGALRAKPEMLPMSAQVTSLSLGQLDDEYAFDLAVAATRDLVLVHGRDRKLSLDPQVRAEVKEARKERRSFATAIKSVAVGSFRGQRPDLAVLTEDGSVRVLSRGAATRGGNEELKLADWVADTATDKRWPDALRLVSGRVSGDPVETLLVLDPGSGQLHAVSEGARPSREAQAAKVTDIKPPSTATLDVEGGGPEAVLPMRLNSSALHGIVALSEGQSWPAVIQPAAVTTFVVNSNADTDDGVCNPTNCTFREALNAANANPGVDNIHFSLPSAGTTIAVTTPLPEIISPVVIDGTTQPGFAGSPIVRLQGATQAATFFYGLTISAGNSTVRGLIFTGWGSFAFGMGAIQLKVAGGNFIEGNIIGTSEVGVANVNATGIEIVNTSLNTIGGTTAAAGNTLTRCANSGIFLGSGNVVQGNVIRLSNTWGVVGGNSNTIGGAVAGAGNIISSTVDGSNIQLNGSGNLIQGNQITGALSTFASGVQVSGSNNTIGGTTAVARNVISGITINVGLLISGEGNQAQGNFIGTDSTGTLRSANETGVSVVGSNNTIGGTVTGARNIISGNNSFNVRAISSGSQKIFIQGNFIGTDVTGTKSLTAPTGLGLSVSTGGAGIVVGGPTVEARNIISGSRDDGIDLGFVTGFGPQATYAPGGIGITVENNYIGTDVSGTLNLGNGASGISVNTDAFANTIRNNLVAYSGSAGVRIPNTNSVQPGVPSNRIFLDSNRIFSNGALGIDLGAAGVTDNDLLDPDDGANLQQNFPVLTGTSAPGVLSAGAAKGGVLNTSAAAITVNGTLNSRPSTTYTIHWYFANAQCDQNNQAQSRPLTTGKVEGVTTDEQGNAPFSFPFSFPPGTSTGIINCTATDPNGNTSEFSSCLPVKAPPGALQFSGAAYQVGEGAGGAVINVTRTGGDTGPVSVNYATSDGTARAGSDYTAASGTLNFADLETTKTFTVPVADDAFAEGGETVNLTLSGPTGGAALGARSSAVLTIGDDDAPPALSVNDVSVVEGNGGSVSAVFALTLSPASGQQVTVNYATADGTAAAGGDYVAAAGALSFSPGETAKTVAVTVNGDAAAEEDETFFLDLSGAANATLARQRVACSIRNDDAGVQLDRAAYAAAENARSVRITVLRFGDLSGPAQVDYETADGTAKEITDYNAAVGTLRFEPGESSKSFDLFITDDVWRTGDSFTVPQLSIDIREAAAETLSVTLKSPVGVGLGPQSSATVTIENNDQANLPLAPNPNDSSADFVRQHYRDFLGRDPDSDGLQFWIGDIEQCGADAGCREVKRINVSAAFFLSIEFRKTGYFNYLARQAAFDTGEHLALRAFASDIKELGEGVVVGVGDWEQRSKTNRENFIRRFVAQPQFLAAYPPSMPPAQFVDGLHAHTYDPRHLVPGGVLTQGQRDQLVADLTSGAKTRAEVLLAIVENPIFQQRQFNKAFVMMQYFGYLRREPDQAGFDSWLGKLEEHGGNYISAEMVKAFLSSFEYRGRFGQP